MSEQANATGVPRRPRFRISLKMWLLVIAIVTCLVACSSCAPLSHPRTSLT